MAIESSKHCPFCGDDHKSSPFAIYEDGYHCFSCGAHKRARRDFSRPRTIKNTTIMLPFTCESSFLRFSLEAQKWLTKYHIGAGIVNQHNIMEAPDISLIMPVLDDEDVLVMYQRRWLLERKIITYGTKAHKLVTNYPEHSKLVITEDFISAIRVGELTNSLCLFGTSIKNDILKDIIKKYNEIIVWLDGDEAGQSAAHKLIENCYTVHRRLKKLYSYDNNVHNLVVRNIYTRLDPKLYTKSEIQTILNL